MPSKLIQLEVENFKSYRGHHLIGPFIHPFTAVIGPNGSGKSNLMDAISFVLGVKTSQLRSSQLKDLINRVEPVPETAYVSVLLQVNDNEEWEFKRSILSSGSSEYRLNGKVVSWATYNAALEDLNILVKARNFLVFQGDVETVASQSPKELSNLIEQISGSIEYKQEYEKLKAEQERATEDSAFNFNKKRGINAEIKQFKEQKDEALRFEKLQDEKDHLISTHLIWKLFHIEKEKKQIGKNIQNKRKEISVLQKSQEQLENEYKAAKKEQAKGHKETLKQEKQLGKLKGELEEKKPTSLKMNEQIKHAKKKFSQHSGSKEKLEKEIKKQETDLADLEQQYQTVCQASERFEESVLKKSKKNTWNLTQEQLNEYAQLKEQVNALTLNERQQMEDLKRQIRIPQDNLNRLLEKSEALVRRESKLVEDEQNSRERLEKILIFAKQLESEKKAAQKDLDRMNLEKKKLEQMEKEIEERLAKVYNQLTQAKYDKKESERSQRLNQAFDTMKRIFPGVYGKVIDLCKPTQKKYENGICTALGKHLDSIVVENTQTAIQCIQYLKEQQIGLATFLPLDSLLTKPINEKYRSFAKGARLIIDCLQFDASLQSAFQYVCSNTLLCDNLTIARDICFNRDQHVKAVTLDGTVIHKSGLMTGGQNINQSQHTRWEAKQLDDLRRSKDRWENELVEIAKSKKKLATEENFEAALLSLENRHQLAMEESVLLERKLSGIQKEIEFFRKEHETWNKEKSELEQKISEIKKEMETQQQKIDSVANEIFQTFCVALKIKNIKEYEGDDLNVSQEISDKRLQFSTQKSKLENEINFSKDQLKTLEEQLEKLKQKVEEEETSLAQLNQEKEKLEAEIEQLTNEINKRDSEIKQQQQQREQSEAVKSLHRTLQGCQREIDLALQEITVFDSQLEKILSERYDIFKKCKLEEIELPFASGSLDDVPMDETERDENDMDLDADIKIGLSQKVAGIEVDFSDLDDDLKEDDSETTEAKFQERIKKITTEIERMAPNLKAIERLDNVENRLKQTNEEFENARKQAKISREKFNQIKQKRYQLFYKAFSHISEKIDLIYKELTKSRTHPLGGTAYLTLMNQEEPYLDGVKFHAMPPMKRFRDMEQLSGGEKTMAALALLFAIHSFHPSPFFVLDEVDAALDYANLTKVAKYIESNAGEGMQFIVISLKSGLYEKASSLVGICRENSKQSSRVLTLDLTPYAS